MSADLLQAAKRAVEKAAQHYDKLGTPESENAYLKARNHLLDIKGSIKDNQLRDNAREIAQLKSTLRITYDREMDEKGFQSIGELANRIAYKVKPRTPRQQAEALFEQREAGE